MVTNSRLSAMFALLVLTRCAEAATLYVDEAAQEIEDGSSWCNAFPDLQLALNVVLPGDEIRVAQGIYRPAAPGGSREATFELFNNVAIRGGYAGCNAQVPDARDPDVFVTILTGDLNGDDAPGFANIDDNSFHVVTASGTDGTALIDGFVIEAGNADGACCLHNTGAGILNVGGSPYITNCTIRNNRCINSPGGAGMRNVDGANPLVQNCVFEANEAVNGAGGGMSNEAGSSPDVIKCLFIGNMSDLGGGVSNDINSDGIFTRCIFDSNLSFLPGGGMHNAASSPSLFGCLFRNNIGPDGGAMTNFLSTVSVINSVFIGNISRFSAGGINNTDSMLFLTNCTFASNLGGNAGAVLSQSSGSVIINNCILWGNEPTEVVVEERAKVQAEFSNIEGGFPGLGNLDANPAFVDLLAGDLRLATGSPCIDAGNNALVQGEIKTDFDENNRFVDVPEVTDCPQVGGKCGVPPIIDLGAFEHQVRIVPSAESWHIIILAGLMLVAGSVLFRGNRPPALRPGQTAETVLQWRVAAKQAQEVNN